MKHEIFPPIPHTRGAYFNNPGLKAQADARINNTPASRFIAKQYYVPSPRRGVAPRACKLAMLALTGDPVADQQFVMTCLKRDDSGSRDINEVLAERYNFPEWFCNAVLNVYDELDADATGAQRKRVASQIMAAIQPGTDLDSVGLAFDRSNPRGPHAERYLELIDLLHQYTPAHQPVDMALHI